MNSKLLVAHLNRISDTTEGVPRLRRFIFDLAVRGKLVDQDPTDEPASTLLKRILSEKARLVEIGAIRKHPPLAEVTPEEIPFTSPSGWTPTRLGDVVHLISGQHLQPNEYSNEKHKGIPYITGPADFGPSGLIISRYALARKAIATDGQLLLTVKGAGVGKTATCDRSEVAISRQLMAMTAIAWSQRFLALITHRLAETLKKNARSLIPGISREDVDDFVLLLPPLSEQHRIVAKVDELMALCDRLEDAQRERENRRDLLAASVHHHLNNGSDAEALRSHARFFIGHLPRITARPDQIKQLRQTIIDLAVRGKLVEQKTTEEAASRLLQRIGFERMRLEKASGARRKVSSGVSDPADAPAGSGELPPGWAWARIADLLVEPSQNGYSKKPDDAPEGAPILRISAGTLRKDGIVAEEQHKRIGGISAAEQSQFQLRPGDLVACRFNGNKAFVGKLALYTGYLGIDHMYPDKLIRLRVFPGFVEPKLIQRFADSGVVRKQVESFSATTVGNWGISASNLATVMIPLPPLGEQRRIVSRIDELMSICTQLEEQLGSCQSEASHLLESVLHNALNSTSLAQLAKAL